MECLVANVEHVVFDIETALDEQYGALPLPFPGMDSKPLFFCKFIFFCTATLPPIRICFCQPLNTHLELLLQSLSQRCASSSARQWAAKRAPCARSVTSAATEPSSASTGCAVCAKRATSANSCTNTT